MSSPTRSYLRWCRRIDDGTFTKAQCNTFANTVAAMAAHQRIHRNTVLTTEEAEALYDRIHEVGGVRLTEEHHRQGWDWLGNHGLTRLKMPTDAVTLFSHFTYTGDQVAGRPVWRIHLTDGRTLDYFNVAWVSAAGLTEEQRRGWWWTADADAEREEMNR